MSSRIFACKDCGADVKWNSEYFEAKKLNEPLLGISPTLDPDGIPHRCQKNHDKKFTILPGTDYFDLHALDLELGRCIEGFLFGGGLKVCKIGNTIPYTFKIETELRNLKLHLKLLSFPVTISLLKNFEEEFQSFKLIKLPSNLKKSEMVTLSKTLTSITLEQFIGFHYCQDQVKRFKIKHFETGQKIPFKQVIFLLLRKHGLRIAGPEKILIIDSGANK